MGQSLFTSSIPGNGVTRRTTFTLIDDVLNGFHGCQVVINLKGMSTYRPFTEVNLSVPISSEYTVVSPAISKITEGIQNVIVKSAYCVVMLDNFYVIAWKMTVLKQRQKQTKPFHISQRMCITVFCPCVEFLAIHFKYKLLTGFYLWQYEHSHVLIC